MNIVSWIGNITLNIAFVLYLIVYIPQIIHNQKDANIAQLSVGLHFLLFSSYLFDVLYGFASHLPWQYKTVSIVGLLLVTIQHIQLITFFVVRRFWLRVQLGIVIFILNYMGIYYFFIIKQGVLDYSDILIAGSIARTCGIIYCLPQIIKNKMSKSANAISLKFIYLNLFLAILDTTSSWCLDWGWPNKVAAPVNVFIMFVMLSQTKKYEHAHTPPIYN